MRILLTNDDGIRAPGIAALYRALLDTHGEFGGPLGEIFTVAPLTVQSATGHGVTFHQPLMVDNVHIDDELTGVAVDGRPADCVKLALSNLYGERYGENELPDLVISGMNAGANVGINIIYSGTVAAALEAAFLGVPSLAVSLHLGDGEPDYRRAARQARRAIERVLASVSPTGEPDRVGLDRHTCINIGIPRTELGVEEPPIVVCPMNVYGHVDAYERRVSPAGDVYYWSAGSGLDFRDSEEGADVEMMWRGCITVTPLRYDLTRHDSLQDWIGRLGRAETLADAEAADRGAS